MLFFLLGTVATFVAAYFTFRTANENGRSGIVWGFISLLVGFGLQIVAPFVLGVLLVVIMLFTGTPQSQIQSKIDGPANIIFYVFWLLGFVGLFLVIKFVSRLPETDESDIREIVPPPPTFNNDL
jgi:MFS family permease